MSSTAVRAADVAIAPTRVVLAHAGETADVTLENVADRPVAFAVRGFAWHQDPAGNVALAPTSDLVVYPQRLTLAAHERRPIRIGTTLEPGTRESDYRIIVTELASPAGGAPALTLAVRSQFSIPVFVAPVAPKTAIDVVDASTSIKELRFSIVETGSAHAVGKTVDVRAFDDAGTALASADLPAWYLLQDQPRVYVVPIDAAACARITHVTIDATFEGQPARHVTLAPKRSC